MKIKSFTQWINTSIQFWIFSRSEWVPWKFFPGRFCLSLRWFFNHHSTAVNTVQVWFYEELWAIFMNTVPFDTLMGIFKCIFKISALNIIQLNCIKNNVYLKRENSCKNGFLSAIRPHPGQNKWFLCLILQSKQSRI